MAAVSATAAAPIAAASLRIPLSTRPRHSVSFAAAAPRPPALRLGLGARCLAAAEAGGGGGAMRETLDKVVGAHKVVLFMKGTKDFPQCGFSHTVVQILRSLDVPFETLDVLANEALRQGLKEYSSWPTFPQLYIDGEFFGGCDITLGNILCSLPYLLRISAALQAHGLAVLIVVWEICLDRKSVV